MNRSAEDNADAVRLLRAGGVLLLATDTLPGLHCRADDPVAVGRLNRLKGRSIDKPLLVLAGSVDQALALTSGVTSRQLATCKRCWPGPFSLILPAAPEMCGLVTGGGATLAVRVPAFPALCELILAVGVALVSSSANLAGQAPALDLNVARDALGAKVDGVWGQPGGMRAAPSALVDLTASPFIVLRPGPRAFPAD